MSTGLFQLPPPPSVGNGIIRTHPRCFSPTAAAPEFSGDDAKEFSYSRASPTVRWPHLKLPDSDTRLPPHPPIIRFTAEENSDGGDQPNEEAGEEVLGAERASRTRVKKMNKLALKRVKDWKERLSS